MNTSIQNKKIFIFGGSGSLGNSLASRYINDNIIINYSRDETKQWEMGIKFTDHKSKLEHIIGDIRDYSRVSESLKMHNPHYIIIASALKHIDRCERNTHECVQTNLIGIANVLNSIKQYARFLDNLESVCFISTDKACSPVNIYGMCKASAEKMVQECAFYFRKETDPKFVIVRYGNVLNSRGSIIPFLHKIGKNNTEFTLTDPQMTRFIMTLDESVDLIEYSLLYSPSGYITIPKLPSMKITDLFSIFQDMYGKPIRTIGLRPGEKMYESLINDTQARRTIVANDLYYFVLPDFVDADKDKIINKEFNSNMSVIGKQELKKILQQNNLL